MPFESGGIWMVFPIVFLVFMLIMMTRMMGLWGGRGGGMGRGPMGVMDDHDHDHRSAPSPAADDPMDVLRGRYAAGEITDEQFETMRRNLEGS